MQMNIGMLDHYNVSTRKLQETIQFYQDVLGFVNGHRPPFNFPGAWLYSAGHPVLHLNDISQTDAQQRDDLGVIDHVAFASPCNVHRSKPSFAGEEDFGVDKVEAICRPGYYSSEEIAVSHNSF